MTTLAVVTLESSAPAVVRWAARFAHMRVEPLLVLCCQLNLFPT